MIIEPFISIPLMVLLCIVLLFMKRPGVWNFIKQIFIVVLLFGLNLRILLPLNDTTVQTRPIDILFVVDDTLSMLAEDFDNDGSTRISAVKNDMTYIMNAYPNSRYALITFDNRAEYIVPYTYERNLILNEMDILGTRPAISSEGTSINIVLDPLNAVLNRNSRLNDSNVDGEQQSNTNEATPIQMVFFISDGEITNGEPLCSFSDVSEYIDTGAVLGYGTTTGGIMRVSTYSGSDPEILTYYDANSNLATAVSQIDENNLVSIANDLNIDYFHITDSDSIKTVINSVNTGIEDDIYSTEESKIKNYKETYHYFAIGLIVFLFTDYLYTRIKMRRER